MAIIEGARVGVSQSAGAPGAGTDEVQTLTFGGTPTGGTFRLAFEGFTTEPITWVDDDDAGLVAAIDAALEALPTIGAGRITAAAGTLSSGVGTVTLTFAGTLGKRAVATITVADNSLEGTDPTVEIAETTPGVTAFGAGELGKGSLVADTTNGKLYMNTGTAAAPTWTVVGTQT